MVSNEKLEAWKKEHGFTGFFIDLNKGNPQFEADVTQTLSGIGHPGLLNDIRLLAANAGFPEAPFVFIHTVNNFNAGAVKIDGWNGMLIQQGLMKVCTPEQLRGVLGHEMAHLSLGHHDKGFSLASLVRPLRMWKERREEKQADKAGAVIAGGIEGMTSFLGNFVPPATGAPGRIDRIRTLIKDLGEDHPSEARRIDYLERFAAKHAAKIEAGKSSFAELCIELSGHFSHVAPRPTAQPAQASKASPTGPAAKP